LKMVQKELPKDADERRRSQTDIIADRYIKQAHHSLSGDAPIDRSRTNPNVGPARQTSALRSTTKSSAAAGAWRVRCRRALRGLLQRT
jgi:hypothetical protein